MTKEQFEKAAPVLTEIELIEKQLKVCNLALSNDFIDRESHWWFHGIPELESLKIPHKLFKQFAVLLKVELIEALLKKRYELAEI